MSKVIEKKIKRTFSGHETFSCRSYWPKKGYEFLNNGFEFIELELKFSFKLDHNTEVSADKKNTDTQTALTLVYSF